MRRIREFMKKVWRNLVAYVVSHFDFHTSNEGGVWY